MHHIPRIMLTAGEPAGIGPDVILKIAMKPWPAELIVVSDPDLLYQRAKLLNLSINIQEFDLEKRTQHSPGMLTIIPVPLKKPSVAGKLSIDNAHFVIQSLEVATDFCLAKKAEALVTGPIQKSILNEAGIAFTGHTEFLAERSKVDDVIMLFVVDNKIRVALLTTHIPLAAVPKAITVDKLKKTIYLLHKELKKKFSIKDPCILVCGLNPHAGENGYLGEEEINIITPTLHALRQEKINVFGPLPADTLFTEKYLKKADAILAMYHDQALPVVKYMGFGCAVNVTLGLPFIRTSVDHGTALDISGTEAVDPGSMHAALQLAIHLERYRE